MIVIPVKKCSKINCNELINFNKSYCDEHESLKNESRKNYDSKRYSNDKQVRQTYNVKRWKDIAKAVMLRDNGLCQYCLYRDSRYEVATCVDHYIPVRDAYDDRYNKDNLFSSCTGCNNRKATDEDKLRRKEITFEEFKLRWQTN